MKITLWSDMQTIFNLIIHEFNKIIRNELNMWKIKRGAFTKLLISQLLLVS